MPDIMIIGGIEVETQYTSRFEYLDYSDLNSRTIVISNALIRAAQSLTLNEKRILMACITKLTPENRVVELHAKEYSATYGVDTKNAYNDLKESSLNIFKKHIRGVFKNGIEVYLHWCSQATYEPEQGKIILAFTPEIMPYLIGLKSHFTQYKLSQASSLRSVHSWRLMELLQQMRGKQPEGYLIIDINEFYLAMEATESYKNNFSLFKKYCINPAVTELMDKAGWLIDWQPLKMGRRVQAIRFDFEKTNQQTIFNEI